MRCRILAPLALLITLLLAALSTGSAVLLLLSALILVCLLAGFLSVVWASRTLELTGSMDQRSVFRGDPVRLSIRLRHDCLLPIAPVMLELSVAPGFPVRQIRLKDKPGRTQTLTLPFHADHVGALAPGARAWTVEDLLGFFSVRREVDQSLFSLLVLPNRFDTDPLTLSPGDPGSDAIARATEDLSAPSDVRAYQPGDPIKKIHWKLSLRKNELLVRKYDEPILQEALILMDCSRPPSWGNREAEADIRDALLETAASVFADQMSGDIGVHMPLLGDHPVELDGGMSLPLVLENLARVDFSETDRFERVLTLESRRLRKVGCVVIISARLNSSIVDVMTRMRRIGPAMRLYLITFAPDDPGVLPLISRLQQSDIEVAYVQPDAPAPDA